ncbi:sensor histidine kinase [Paenibacillus sp. HW567]|uniref:sensor histidine kinase n=1 Tax=Paenibacillus sp. HW567 TaxID=1034769 RepID=UPI00037B1CB9|nr:sensor histidine kinase [Paenibacillus sp. HW567]
MARRQFRLFPQRLGFFPYVWLIYLVFPILNLQGEKGIKLLLGAALLALFAVTYRQLYWVSGKAFFLWLAVQMLIIIVLSLFYTPFNVYLGFYTSNFVSYTGKKHFKLVYAAFVVMVFIPLLPGIARMGVNDLGFLVPFLLFMLVFPFGMRSLNRSKMLEKELDQANEVIKELVKRDERMRIARDLHDTLGHTLSLITLKSQLVERLAAKDVQRAQAEAREIQRTSRAALRQMRELVSEMRAVTVAEELAEAREMLRTAEIALELEGAADLEGVSDLTQNILSLCIKEAVTNIVKHSEADRCSIAIALTEGEVRLSIRDNGVGLQQRDKENHGRSEGNGMKGMAERLSLIDGSLTLDSGETRGTVLNVVIPRVVKERKEGEAL